MTDWMTKNAIQERRMKRNGRIGGAFTSIPVLVLLLMMCLDHEKEPPKFDLHPDNNLILMTEKGTRLTCPSPLSRIFACALPSGEAMKCRSTDAPGAFSCDQPWKWFWNKSYKSGLFGLNEGALKSHYQKREDEKNWNDWTPVYAPF